MRRICTLLMPMLLALMLLLGLDTVELVPFLSQAQAQTLTPEAFCDEVSEIPQAHFPQLHGFSPRIFDENSRSKRKGATQLRSPPQISDAVTGPISPWSYQRSLWPVSP